MKNSNETKGGFGFLTILFFIFLTLKLTGHIQGKTGLKAEP